MIWRYDEGSITQPTHIKTITVLLVVLRATLRLWLFRNRVRRVGVLLVDGVLHQEVLLALCLPRNHGLDLTGSLEVMSRKGWSPLAEGLIVCCSWYTLVAWLPAQAKDASIRLAAWRWLWWGAVLAHAETLLDGVLAEVKSYWNSHNNKQKYVDMGGQRPRPKGQILLL